MIIMKTFSFAFSSHLAPRKMSEWEKNPLILLYRNIFWRVWGYCGKCRGDNEPQLVFQFGRKNMDFLTHSWCWLWPRPTVASMFASIAVMSDAISRLVFVRILLPEEIVRNSVKVGYSVADGLPRTEQLVSENICRLVEIVNRRASLRNINIRHFRGPQLLIDFLFAS